MPTTRSMAKTIEIELKLRNTLNELKSTKVLCDKLLQEREDNEVEFQQIISKNSELKNELSELDIKYMDILDQRDQLQREVFMFNHCNEIHEQALDRIKELEWKLSTAQALVEQLEAQISNRQNKDTQNLYQQLVGHRVETITDTDTRISRKKCKKLSKINKFIKKTTFQLTQHCNKCRKTDKLRHERTKLLSRLDRYKMQIEKSKLEYDTNTWKLESKISKLSDSLKESKIMYDLAEKQIGDHILSANQLLELCNHNSERFDSLVNKHSCECGRFVSSDSSLFINNNDSVGRDVSIEQKFQQNITEHTEYKTIFYSDGLGIGFGPMFTNLLGHPSMNICYPDAPLDYIIDQVCKNTFEQVASAVVMLGNCSNITKPQIKRNIDKLILLSSQRNCKVTICAFPYCKNKSWSYNKYVYNLNLSMYNMACSHSDIFYFDTNSFVNNFKLTQDTMYLSQIQRKRLANSLAYSILHRTDCIQSVIKCVMTTEKPAAGDNAAGRIQPLNVPSGTICDAETCDRTQSPYLN